ncbi:MAG: hypothetical protein ACE5KI_07345 [Dehalococcoidia bacterium]
MTKAVIGIDLDGVVCRPPFGLNLTIGRGPYRGWEDQHVASALRFRKSAFRVLFNHLKYIGRIPMSDARVALPSIKQYRDLALVTSRTALVHRLVESWLERHEMLNLFESVYTNDTGLPSPEFKWQVLSERGIEEFVDDDGRVADFLGRKGLNRIFLRDWPRNRGYQYPDNVVRVSSLKEVSEHLAGVGR